MLRPGPNSFLEIPESQLAEGVAAGAGASPPPKDPLSSIFGFVPGSDGFTVPLISARTLQLNVLVVDDDSSLLAACCEIASARGFRTLAAGTVQEALEILDRQAVDMLLLDLKLPGGGGLKLLSEVKSLYPETGVVVMTAFATVSSAVEAMRIGAGDYLTKPFALEELTTVLDRSSRRLHFDMESRGCASGCERRRAWAT
jgi:DNA-binding NtrC family response regulator